MTVSHDDSDYRNASILAGRHIRFGWWALVCFVTLGFALEIMHGFKVGWYLEPAFETRRLMWTLGHAHGTLLALVNLVFGISICVVPHDSVCRARRVASSCMIAASILLPGGFFIGGIYTFGGDPGVGVFVVPLGAISLIAGVSLAAVAATRSQIRIENACQMVASRTKKNGE